MELTWDTPVRYIKGVGLQKAEALAELGVYTVGDLLEYFPFRWEFIPAEIKINQIKPDDTVMLRGVIKTITPYQKSRFSVTIEDETDMCQVVWFNSEYLYRKLKCGLTIAIVGKVTTYKGKIQLVNPKFLV